METKTKIFIGIGIFIFIGILIFALATGGQRGLFSVLGVLVKFFFWALFIGAIVGIGYFLFVYERKINARAEVYKDIVRETKINKVGNLGDLYSSGDEEHTPIKYGRILGYGARQNYDTFIVEDKEGDKKQMLYYYNESIFRVRRTFDNPLVDLIGMLFLRKVVVRCPSIMHDRLQGDVRINCITLVKHGHYYYPNTLHLNFEAVDKTIFNEGMRYINMDIIRLAHPLIMKGMGVSRFDRKELEGMRGIEMVREGAGQVLPPRR